MIPFDLLPQPLPQDASSPEATYRWLYRVWLKLRNSYQSSADLGVFMNASGVSSISAEPTTAPAPIGTVSVSVVERTQMGDVDDLRKDVKKILTLIHMGGEL
jgi:hypothetical protein